MPGLERCKFPSGIQEDLSVGEGEKTENFKKAKWAEAGTFMNSKGPTGWRGVRRKSRG